MSLIIESFESECVYLANLIDGLIEVVESLKELLSVVLLRDKDSLPLVGEMLIHLSGTAIANFDDLWPLCASVQTDISMDKFSARAKKLSFSLLDIYSSFVLELEILNFNLCLVAESAIVMARWCAKWSWLRYENPPLNLWLSAADFYRCAELWAARCPDFESSKGAAGLWVVEQNYLAILVLDRLCPNSFSRSALSLFDGLLNDSLIGIHLTKEANAITCTLLNASNGRLEIDDGKNQFSVNCRHRFVSIGNVLVRLTSHLSEIDESENDACREAKHVVLMCSSVGWDGRR